ncbi:hypothetical protein ACIRVK_00460 [Streptomyces sp. NPDC101152]|uniref:hypothetical protein n=1 Tax=Streptomyces sp. NPDC101152 TaxID=3366116 RepID=UPI00381AB907
MTSVSYMIDESACSQDADIWFALPAGFVPLPLHELNEAARTAQTAWQGDLLRPLLETMLEGSARQRLLTDLGPVLRMAQLLLAAGAVKCCLGLHRDDEGDGRLLLSLFTLASRATDWAPRSVLAARAAMSAQGADQILTLDLPCGPASLVQVSLNGAPEKGIAEGHRLLQITAYVPCPDGRRIALLTLATTAVDQAEYYRALLSDIAGTVSFDNPLPNVIDDVPDED